MSKESSSSGIGATGLLGIVFITLKLTKVIDWSWWWVLSPFWGTLVFALFIILIAVIYDNYQRKKIRKWK